MGLYKKKWLFLLRICTFILLFLFILEPIGSILIRKNPTITILIDSSKSMKIVSAKVHKLVDAIKRLKLKKEFFSFDKSVTRRASLSLKDSLAFTGNRTDIGTALSSVTSRASKNTHGSILLISDGNNNMGKDPIQIAQNLSIPIYCLGIGCPVKDIKITDINTNSIVYVNDSIQIRVTFENRGYKEQDIQVFLEQDGRILKKKQVPLPSSMARDEVKFFIVPRHSGLNVYTIRITPLADEITTENNKREISIKVLKDKIKVLYVSSSPTWNFKFAKKELAQDDNILLDYYIKIDKERFLTPDGFVKILHLTSHIPHLASYDLVILEGFEPPEIKEYVDRGGNLVLIGKSSRDLSPFIFGVERGFIPRLLPRISPATKVEFSSEGERIFFHISHPPRKGSEATSHISLPNILGVKGGANILASIRGRSHRSIPIIALQSYGKGRILGIASKDIWKWSFRGESHLRDGSLWSNITRYLSKRGKGKRIYIHTEPCYITGEEIVLKGELYDENYKPVLNGEIKVEILGRNKTLYPLGDGRYEGKIGSFSPGKYTYFATGTIRSGEANHEPRVKGEFFVEEPNLEEMDVGLNRGLLESIATASNGKYIEDLKDLTLNLKPTREKIKLHFTRNPFFLVLILSLLCLEWFFLRKG